MMSNTEIPEVGSIDISMIILYHIIYICVSVCGGGGGGVVSGWCEGVV